MPFVKQQEICLLSNAFNGQHTKLVDVTMHWIIREDPNSGGAAKTFTILEYMIQLIVLIIFIHCKNVKIFVPKILLVKASLMAKSSRKMRSMY